MGHDSLASNYLTIPVYVLGALGFFTFAFLSDKYGKCGVVSHSLTKTNHCYREFNIESSSCL